MMLVVAIQTLFIFTPKIGEDEPILTGIFFRWVGSTTNQMMLVVTRVVVCSIEPVSEPRQTDRHVRKA